MKEIQTQFEFELTSETQSQRIGELYLSIRQRIAEELSNFPNFPTGDETFFDSVDNRVSQFLSDHLDRDDPQDRYLIEAVAGAFIVECRVREIPVTANEISSLVDSVVGSDIDIKKSRVMKRKRELDQLAGEWTQPSSPETFIERYADDLDLHPDTVSAAINAIQDVEGNDSTSGTNPSITAAAALWVGSRRSGEPIRQQDILDVSGVGESQLRKRTKGIESTDGYVKLVRTVDREISLPSELISWLDLTGKYIEWPDPSEVGKKEHDGNILAVLRVIEQPTEDSDPVDDTIQVPTAIRDRLPRKACWGWDDHDGEDVLLLREP